MSEAETRQWYEKLAAALRQLELEWVLDQVTDHLRRGKTTEEEIQTLRESSVPVVVVEQRVERSSPSTSAYRPGRRARFLRTRDYAPREAVEILIEAIERAVVDTGQMQAEILDHLSHGETEYEVAFAPEDTGQPIRRLTRSDALARQDNASRLREMLEAVRREG